MKELFEKLGPWLDVAGRILIAWMFVTSGFGKIGGYEGTEAYMASMGVPGALLPLVIVTELGGGLLIVFGLFTRYAAIALAGFSILAGVLFHAGSPDHMQQIMFMKNLSIAGGFLFLAANGAGRFSLDQRRGRA